MQQQDQVLDSGLTIAISPREQTVEPGERATFELTLENRTDQPQSQSLAVEGLAAEWVSLDFDAQRQAFPGEQRGALLTLSVPTTTPGGRISFRVLSRAANEVAAVTAHLRVAGSTAIPADAAERLPPGIALEPDRITAESGSQSEHLLVLTVRNIEPVEASYQLALEGLPEEWYQLPSVIRVPAQGTVDLDLHLRVAAPARSGVYEFVARAEPAGIPALAAEAVGQVVLLAPSAESAALRRTAEPRPQVGVAPPVVSMTPSEFLLEGGQVTAQATITIQNATELLEHYTVGVSGLPRGWYELSRQDLALQPGAAEQVILRLTPRLGATQPAGDYPFTIRVEPRSAPGAATEVGAHLSIEGLRSFDARVAPLQAQGRRETFKVTLRNTGTVPLSLWVEGSDSAGMCRFTHGPPPNLAPGEEHVLRMKVGVRRNRLVGRPRSFDFSIRVLPAGEASAATRSFDGRLVHEPYLTPRMLKWSLLAALAVIAIGLVLSIGPGRFVDGAGWIACRFQQRESCPEAVERPAARAGLTTQAPISSMPPAAVPWPAGKLPIAGAVPLPFPTYAVAMPAVTGWGRAP